MSYYGYAFPGMSGVCENFSQLEPLTKIFPYPKYRVFATREEAQEFVRKYGDRPKITTLDNYGNTFKKMFIRAQYFLGDNRIYLNIFPNNIGDIDLNINDPLCICEKKHDVFMIEIRGIQFNKMLVTAHAIAIQYILKIVGEYIDVCIEVPSRGIFYMLTSYTGHNSTILKMHDKIHNRLGEISVRVKEW